MTQSVTSYAARLLKRADQCRAACAASHLAWQDNNPALPAGTPGGQPPARDAQRVMAGLKRALKVAAAAKQQRAASARPGGQPAATGTAAGVGSLYVEIANHYLYYLGCGVDAVSPSVVQQLLELVASELGHQQQAEASAAAFWAATRAHVAAVAAAEAAVGSEARFGALTM